MKSYQILSVDYFFNKILYKKDVEKSFVTLHGLLWLFKS